MRTNLKIIRWTRWLTIQPSFGLRRLIYILTKLNDLTFNPLNNVKLHHNLNQLLLPKLLVYLEVDVQYHTHSPIPLKQTIPKLHLLNYSYDFPMLVPYPFLFYIYHSINLLILFIPLQPSFAL